MCFPLRTVAFRAHGFSLLALAKGLSTLFAKNGFSLHSLEQLCRVFRHVLFPQDKEGFDSIASHEENWFVFSRSQRSSTPNNDRKRESKIYRTVAKPHVSEGNARRLLEKEHRFFCVRCVSQKLSLSCAKAKTMRPHNERPLRVRRLIASPRKA